jgi:hypothetical protein
LNNGAEKPARDQNKGQVEGQYLSLGAFADFLALSYSPDAEPRNETTLDGIGRSANAPKSFSLAYCFFVIMGGFIISTQEIDPERSYSTITAKGILALAREGQFVSIDESQITDRSKADILAKGLVCLQVL